MLMTAAVYLPVATHRFINFDDPDYVSGNPYVQAGLRPESIRWAFTGVYSSNWHPLTWMSHMLDCQIYGLKPAGHHLTNVVFHIGNTVLVFLLLKAMTRAFWRSAFVAALFALHPLHVESVAWVAERKDVLSGFFGLLSLLAYLKYVKCVSKNGFFYVLALVLFALGLMAKPMLVTLPFVLLLLDFWPLHRFQLATPNLQPATTLPHSNIPTLRLILEKLPFFVLSVASCVVTFLAQKACGAMVPLTNTPVSARLANAVVSYERYLAKTFWPTKLAVFYPYQSFDWDSAEVLIALLVIVLATGIALWVWKRRPYWPVGWFWFVGILVPVIGVVQVGKQALADRYTYLPHIGLFIIIAWGAAEVIARRQLPRGVGFAASGLVLAASAVVTVHQLAYWRNTKTLFEHAIAVTKGNFVAYTVIASELVESNKLSEATEDCRLALLYSECYPEAHNTLGAIYAKQERYEEAIESYKKALECDPNYGDPCYGLATLYLKQKKYPAAELQAREALRRAPMHIPSMYCLAMALHNEGKLNEAADYYGRLIKMNPNLFSPHRLLGNVLAVQSKPDEAIAQYRIAGKIRPDDSDTHIVLGLMLAEKNQREEATKEFMEATHLQPTNAVANYQLALIYQGRKETQKAIDYYNKTLHAQPDFIEALNNLAWLLAANHDPALRNGPEAVTLAESACKLSEYKTPVFVGTLAAAYAEAGRYAEAVTTAEKARDLAAAAGQKETADRNNELLQLYRAGRAYHEAE
jgi:tetratricopeptide (TPR) repeat protein